MKTSLVYNKIVNGVRKISGRNVMQRQALVTKPDVIDIQREPKLSKWNKIKKLIKSNILNLDKKTVKELEKCSIDDFFEKSRKLVIDSYQIPGSLGAQMQILPDINKKAGMMYDFCSNTIYVNPKILKMPRSQIFAYIKHEYTHQKQNYQILRTEGLGEKAIQEYAKIKAGAVAEQFVEKFSKMDDKEFQTLPPQQQMLIFPWLVELRNCIQQGGKGISEYKEKVYKNDYPIILDNLEKLRQNVIQELGIIPANSKEAKNSEVYFKNFIELYKDPLNLKLIIKSVSETEAYLAQSVATFEYIYHKFV